MKNLEKYLIKPSPVPLRAPTTYKTGGPAIVNPIHGMSGWFEGKLFIYNDKWGEYGWYYLKEYQTLKVLGTEKTDWRIMPRIWYTPEPDTFAREIPQSHDAQLLGIFYFGSRNRRQGFSII